MAGISSRTIARVRSILNDFLTDTCEIEEQIYTTGSMGQQQQSWVSRGSGVSCRVIRAGRQSNEGSAEVQVGQEVIEDTVRIILPHGTVIDVDYRVTVTDGQAVQVVAIEDALTDKAYVSVIGKRIR